MCEQLINRWCGKCGWGLPLLLKTTTKTNTTTRKRLRGTDDVVEKSHWKQVYCERMTVEKHWRTLQFQLDAYATDEPVTALCMGITNHDTAIAHEWMVTGHNDGRLMYWLKMDGRWELQHTPWNSGDGHRLPITSLSHHSDKHTLLSTSHDGTVRVWSLKTFECLRVFRVQCKRPRNAPTDEPPISLIDRYNRIEGAPVDILSVAYRKDVMMAGTTCGLICIWHCYPGGCEYYTLDLDMDCAKRCARQLRFIPGSDDLCIAGFGDARAFLFNWKTGQVLVRYLTDGILESRDRISCIQVCMRKNAWLDGPIVLVSYYRDILIFNYETGQVVTQLSASSSVYLYNIRYFAACSARTVVCTEDGIYIYDNMKHRWMRPIPLREALTTASSGLSDASENMQENGMMRGGGVTVPESEKAELLACAVSDVRIAAGSDLGVILLDFLTL